ncbi:MAG: hypothetical protein ACO1QR_13890 [Chthoniobacteraceae bacterium]
MSIGAAVVYRALKSHGEEAGLRLVRDELGRRFARTARPEEEEEEPVTPPAASTGGAAGETEGEAA